MKAIILAAGRGSRMKDITNDYPKCLTVLGGKSLLHWQIEALNGADIRDISIVRGYLAEKITIKNMKFFDNTNWETTNMVYSLCCASEWLSNNICIVSYSDIVYPSETILTLAETDGDIVIAYNTRWFKLWNDRFINPLDDLETFKIDADKILIEIGKNARTLEEIQGQYMGLLKITPKGWKLINKYISDIDKNELNKLDMTSLLNTLIENKVIINTVPISGKWIEVDTRKDLELYKTYLKNGDNFYNY